LPSKQSPPTDRTVEYSWQLCLRQLSSPSSESRVMATLSPLPSAPLQSVSAPEASVKSALPSSLAHEIGTSSYIILGNEDSEPIEAWPEERENRSAWRRRSPASPHRRWERTGNQAATYGKWPHEFGCFQGRRVEKHINLNYMPCGKTELSMFLFLLEQFISVYQTMVVKLQHISSKRQAIEFDYNTSSETFSRVLINPLICQLWLMLSQR
jgi:hypothetical protein